jgi:hypothetical protein
MGIGFQIFLAAIFFGGLTVGGGTLYLVLIHRYILKAAILDTARPF